MPPARPRLELWRSQRAANWCLAAWIGVDAVRSFASAASSGGGQAWSDSALGLVLLLNAFYVMRRTAPAARLQSRAKNIFILASLLIPVGYLFVEVDPGRVDAWAVAAEWLATGLLLWSISALGRNFSILPQRRAIVTSGPYALVRHPIYTSYLLFDFLYCVTAVDRWVTMLWIVEAATLFVRARWEEDVLAADEAYREYAVRVRFRLLPFVI